MSASRMPAKLILVLAAVLLISPGCAAPFGGRSQSADGDQSQSSLFDVDKFPDEFKKTTKKLIGKGENPDKARELYAAAEAKYEEAPSAEPAERGRLFAAAAKEFKEAAERWPDSALEQDALYLSGECHFFADHYPKANQQYEELLKKYPNSRYLDVVESRRFAIAQFWLQWHDQRPQAFWAVNVTDKGRPWRDQFGNAVRIYDRIRVDDPTGKLADDATLAAGNAYFGAHRFMDADNFYTDLRKTFPNSEHQFAAHLLGLKAKLLSYQGPDYAGDALDEAEKLIHQIRRQFPQQAAQEQEYLTRALAEVRYKKAQREWNRGEYHERRAEYAAARFYYNTVVKDFRETPFGPQAEERLVAIGGRPDVPPQRFEWLVDVFPKEENNRPLIATSETPKKR